MPGPPTKRICLGLCPEASCDLVTHRLLQKKNFLAAIFNGVRRLLTDSYGLARMTRWSDSADWDRTQLNSAASYILELLVQRDLVDQVATIQYMRHHISVSQSPYVKILPAYPRHLVLTHPKRQVEMTGLGGMDAYAFEAPGYLVTTIATVHEHLEHPLHPLLADYEIVNIPIEYGTDYESLSGDESSDESDADMVVDEVSSGPTHRRLRGFHFRIGRAGSMVKMTSGNAHRCLP